MWREGGGAVDALEVRARTSSRSLEKGKTTMCAGHIEFSTGEQGNEL